MSYLINNQQKVNDIIFADRNKNYGAYAIRSTYGNTVIRSLIIMITGFGALLGTAYYLCNRQNTEDIMYQLPPDFKITQVRLSEPKVHTINKKTAAPAGAPHDAKPKASGLVTVVDSTIVEKPAVANSEVNPNAVAQGSVAGTPGGGGGGDEDHGEKIPGTDTEIVDPFGVDSQPEFEGGLKALYSFVARNVKYPADAAVIGQEGTVYVKFVVDEKGKVGSLKLLNKAGFGFDDEALRVISIIPDFKTPAKVKGRPVKVYYQMPIKFRLR